MPLQATQKSVEAGEKNGKIEGLGKIVVSTGSESAEDVFGAAARGKHEHRKVILLCAQLGDDVESALAGEHDVEAFALQPGECGFSVALDGGVVAFGLKVEEQTLGEVRLVFDDEDAGECAHCLLSSCSFAVCRSRRGSWTLTVVPLPSPALSAKASPPCWRAIVRTMK